MLKEPGAHQHALEMVTLESLVPSDHLLRQIDACIDFEFIRNKVKHLNAYTLASLKLELLSLWLVSLLSCRTLYL